jgi:hypothetical protein
MDWHAQHSDGQVFEVKCWSGRHKCHKGLGYSGPRTYTITRRYPKYALYQDDGMRYLFFKDVFKAMSKALEWDNEPTTSEKRRR